jgi:GNAT superfamily N-acetyltransferase
LVFVAQDQENLQALRNTMKYTISVFDDPKRIPELVELFRTGLGETSVEHWRWRLFTPNGLEDQPFAVVAREEESERLLGVSTVIPVYYGKDKIKAILFGDWVVHPSARGQGIIGKIFDYICAYAKENGYSFMITFPNQNSYPILKKYGFEDLEGVFSWNSSTSLFLRKRSPKDKEIKGISYRFFKTCPFEGEIPQYSGRLYRNASLLRWKYDLNPDEHYTWLTLWKEDLCLGYFVYQLTKGRLRTAVNVYDWAYYEKDPECFKEAVALLQKQGNFVSFWGKYDEDTQGLLEECGFKKDGGRAVCIVKSVTGDELPAPLTLTRIDTDY